MRSLTRFIVLAVSSYAVALAQPSVTSWNILAEGFNDKVLDVRRQALTAIGAIGETDDTVRMLSKALKDDDLEIRQVAAAVMGQMKCRRCIPDLKTALDDESGEVSFTAAKALWDMGDHTGKEIIQEVLAGELQNAPGAVESAKRDAKAKMHDKRALALMGAKEVGGLVLGPFSLGIYAAEQAFKDGGGSGRAQAATMLGDNCDAHSSEVLQGALDNKNWAVKAAAARALGRCGNKDLIPVLEQKLSDSRPAVRFMAASSIVRLSQPPARATSGVTRKPKA